MTKGNCCVLGTAIWLLVQPTVNLAAESPAIEPAPAFDRQALTAFPRAGWPTNGGDLYNRRYSPLREIDRGNVRKLKAVWRTHLNGSGIGPQYSGEAQPIVYKGTIYVVTGADDVFAIGVETGDILWSYQANLDPDIDTICCGWTSRGVGLGSGKVFVGRLDGKLLALDQTNGEVVWSVQAERWQEGYTITSAPLYYDGMVITGFAGAEYAMRGRVKAYDSNNGDLIWTSYTVPGPGELGHDTWPKDNEVWKRGGASVWQTPAIDPMLGLIYFATGNPGPDFSGAVRGGDNLFTASIMAIEAATGKYRWHFQQVHHDIWDYDSANPVVLFDLELDGKLRKAVAEVSKTGWVYILDRINGEPLIGIDEKPVPQEPRQLTAATQPFPVGDAIGPQTIDIAPEGYELVNDGHIFTPYWTEPVVIRRAGANWPPSAYDPNSRYLFICASDRTFFFSADADEIPHPPAGADYDGGHFGMVSLPASGLLAAMDMTTNRVVWRQRWADRCYSGITATAGGLLFIGRNDGRLTAVDSSDGKKLWEFQTGSGVNAPVGVFEHDGKQYVVAYSAGNMFAGSARGDSVWLFSLKGTLDEVAATDDRSTTSAPASAGDGPAVYARACQFCHGALGKGAGDGADLSASTLSNVLDIARVIRDGRNQMPAFDRILSDEQIVAVAEYVIGFKSH